MQEKVTNEMNTITENISRTRSRIVQSPERIKRDIHNMGNSAAEEKRTVAANEAKTRDLQTKITALLNIEKDVRSCVEQLQTIEKIILRVVTHAPTKAWRYREMFAPVFRPISAAVGRPPYY